MALFYETGGTLESILGVVSTIGVCQRVSLPLDSLYLPLFYLDSLLTGHTLDSE